MEYALINTIIASIVTAFIFGMAAKKMRLPAIFGYLLAGVATSSGGNPASISKRWFSIFTGWIPYKRRSIANSLPARKCKKDGVGCYSD